MKQEEEKEDEEKQFLQKKKKLKLINVCQYDCMISLFNSGVYLGYLGPRQYANTNI